MKSDKVKNGILYSNLLTRYSDKQKENFRQGFLTKSQSWKGMTDTDPLNQLKIGDTVQFLAGYDKNIMYTTEVIGFDTDNKIYMLWDCYWFGIDRDDRTLTLISRK